MVEGASRQVMLYGGVHGFEDIPHEVGHALAKTEPIPASFADGTTRYDGFEATAGDGFILDEVRVCPPPNWFNSGSHRVLFLAHYRGEPFVVAVEELESFACLLAGQQVTFAGASPAAEAMLDASGEELSRLLLEGAWRAVTGKELQTDPDFGAINAPPRFLFERAEAAAILERGCTSNAAPCIANLLDPLLPLFRWVAESF